MTGKCDGGCAAGYRGTLCDTGLHEWMFVIRIKMVLSICGVPIIDGNKKKKI